jgi:hypothetical protein
MSAPHLRLLAVRRVLALGAACAFCSCGGGGRSAAPPAPVGFTPGPERSIPVAPLLTPPHTLLDTELGDHNADGIPDVAWIISTEFTFEATFAQDVLRGTGDGSFADATNGMWYSGLGDALLTTGDVLGAGAGGFVAASETPGGLVRVLTFGQRVDASGTRGVGGGDQWPGTLGGLTVGDVSGDGIADVLIADAAGTQVVAWLSLGESGLSAPQATALPVGTLPTGLVAARLTTDALDDVVVLLGASGYVVLESLGVGHFAAGPVVPLGFGRSFQEAVTGDFDGDGTPDVAGIVSQPGEPDGLGVLPGNGDGTFAPLVFATLDAALGTTALRHLHAGDIDGDGQGDLAFVAPALDRVVVAFSAAAGGFTFAADADLVGGAGDTLSLGDVDLDGDLDLLVGAVATRTIRVLLNDRR